MYAAMTTKCPACSSRDVYGFERTRTGRACYCYDCGTRWKLTVEHEVLDMLGVSSATTFQSFSLSGRR